jgi:uridine monophosphate synthetase
MSMLSYRQRAELVTHPCAKKLLLLAEEKKSNLVLAADVTRSEDLLQLVDAVGPHLCVLKTHIDILEDFTPDVTEKLRKMADQHRFLIFEDRKFADLGNIVVEQYHKGIYRICEWADLINAHILPGQGIIEGLRQIGLPRQRALLLLAQLTSKGSLAVGTYTEKAIELAAMYSDFVIGFLCLHRLSDDPRFLHFTTGIQREEREGTLGQQYKTPQQAIGSGSDFIIVGRGIFAAKDPREEAESYQLCGWESYESRCCHC